MPDQALLATRNTTYSSERSFVPHYLEMMHITWRWRREGLNHPLLKMYNVH